MFQILDSSEIQEAIRLASKLTGGKSSRSARKHTTSSLADLDLENEVELFSDREPLAGLSSSETHSTAADEVVESEEAAPAESPLKGVGGLTGLADVSGTVEGKKAQTVSAAKSSIIDVTEALSLNSDIERPARSGPSLQRSEKKMELDLDAFEYRGDKLEEIIKLMCQRSNFSGAIVTDDGGLPFAVVNPPVSIEAVSAFTSVLGGALERAGELLGHSGAEYLSMDINYEEKVVLRRFMIGEKGYLLLAISPQEVDERSEIEISIEQICEVLTEQS